MPETLAPTPNIYANMLPEGGAEMGFKVGMLPYEAQPVPLNEAIANIDEMRTEFHQRWLNGDGVRVLADGESAQPGEKQSSLWINTVIDQREYDAAVAEGGLTSNDSYARKLTTITPEMAQDFGLLHRFPEKESAVIAEAVTRAAIRYGDADFGMIDGRVINRMEKVHQLFELTAWGKTVRLYNFSETALTEDHMQKISNALRQSSDLMGETVIKGLSVMAIVPENDPKWGEADDLGENVVVNAVTTGGTSVLLNERMFKGDWDAESRAIDAATEDHTVGGGIETTLFHEFLHVAALRGEDKEAWERFSEAVGWEYERDERGKVILASKHRHVRGHAAPLKYGGSEPAEDLPETAAAMYAGGKWADQLDDERIQAMIDFWKAQRTDIQGPAYVHCREVDLQALPKKIGLNFEPVAFKPEYWYAITQPQPVPVG